MAKSPFFWLKVSKQVFEPVLNINAMTTTEKPVEVMSKRARDAVVDQLRACHTPEEILQFEDSTWRMHVLLRCHSRNSGFVHIYHFCDII